MLYAELFVLVGILLAKLLILSNIENVTFLNVLMEEVFYWPVLLTFTLLPANYAVRERIFLAALEIALYFLGEETNLVLLLLILFAADFGPRKTLKVYTVLLGFFYAVTAVLSALGAIASGSMTVAQTRQTDFAWLSVRHAFGFCHPNAAAILLAVWAVMWLILRYGKLKWWDWVLALGVGIVITVVIDSRGALLFYAAFLVLLVVFKCFPKLLEYKLLHGLAVASPVLCALLSFGCAILYNPQNLLWNKINMLASTRPALFHQAWENGIVSLGGQTFESLDVPCLDNAYLSVFLLKGVPWFAVILLIYMLLTHRLWKKSAVPELALVLALFVYFCVESAVLRINDNISLFLLGSILLLRPVSAQQLFSAAEKKQRTRAVEENV